MLQRLRYGFIWTRTHLDDLFRIGLIGDMNGSDDRVLKCITASFSAWLRIQHIESTQTLKAIIRAYGNIAARHDEQVPRCMRLSNESRAFANQNRTGISVIRKRMNERAFHFLEVACRNAILHRPLKPYGGLTRRTSNILID